MKKLLLIAATALVALTNPAAAADPTKIGGWVEFNRPNPIAVGCTQQDDAHYVRKLLQQERYLEMQEYVDWIGSTSADRICIVLNSSPNTRWRVINKIVPRNEGSGLILHCLIGKYDLRTDVNQPASCFWIWMNDR